MSMHAADPASILKGLSPWLDGAGPVLSAPPMISVNDTIRQLRTNWIDGTQATFDWGSVSSIDYYVGGTPYSSSSGENSYVTPMTSLMQSRAVLSFELWDDLIAVSLNPATSAASNQIQFEYATNTINSGTYAKILNAQDVGENIYNADRYVMARSEIWLNSGWTSHNTDGDMYFGGYGLKTYIHEIGHSLGLSHPGAYDASQGSFSYDTSAEYSNDTRQYSVMSYFGGYNVGTGWSTDYGDYYSSTPMIDDISAVQAIYGADMTTRSGNTVYGWGSTADRAVFDFAAYGSDVPIFAIWDGGGIDTINASGSNQNQRIDLTAGNYSSTGGHIANIAIARNVVIENAIGGGGNDVLTGNAANNSLTGGVGGDSLYGLGGTDTIVGGIGNDFIYGGSDRDLLNGGVGNDTVSAGDGNDLVYGDDSGTADYGDNIDGGAGSDALYGFGGADRIYGGADADSIFGGAGADTLLGQAGNDVVQAGTEGDLINGGIGNDSLSGNEGNDFIYGDDPGTANYGDNVDGGAGADSIFGFGGNDVLWGGAEGDSLRGGDGNDTLRGMGGNDYLYGEGGADVFQYVSAGFAVDQLFDFQNGIDLIQIGVSIFADFAAVSASALQVGADVLIDAGDGDKLAIKGFSLANLTADDFLFF
ncbi:hypothetical protein Sa4125_14590 [Aureimonas sp. SA4125]|uniref:M10 family metallopeptidase C-terminal domain-containing protein n=1 Tax=Aureimonas sp. SA4125 TaxID=2826993 RepID=UPI001CC4A2C3|nr:M10 family metallopeptidase C-terminal domain-containing protein [Aureimonas sp. SA4125]BDA83917.1 hypothetical protein Sa4125_14590 [Aureimonas sp. SA4125]